MQLDPNYVRTHFWLGRVYSQMRMHKEAIAASEKILESMPDSTLGLTEMAYTRCFHRRFRIMLTIRPVMTVLLSVQADSTAALMILTTWFHSLSSVLN